MSLLDEDYGNGGITDGLLNMKPFGSLETSYSNYNIARHADDLLGPVTFSPRDLADLDQKMNADWWKQQMQPSGLQEQPKFSLPVSPGGKIVNNTINSIMDDALKLNSNGDLVSPEKAVNLFGGDAQKMHDFMYATSPSYKERHDYWMKKDPPIQSAHGPVEGAV